jgi:hypothetical protein
MQPDMDNPPLIQWIPEDRRSERLIARERGYLSKGIHDRSLDCGARRVAVERVGADGTLTTTGLWVVGDMVGTAGLWDRSGYPASTRALETPMVMGWIARDVVLQLHQEIPQFGPEISRCCLSVCDLFKKPSQAARGGRLSISWLLCW